MNVVEVLRIGKIAVKREGSGNFLLADSVNQLPKQQPVILERLVVGLTLIPFDKATKVQRIVFATGTDIIRKQIVMSNLVAVFGVIPKPAHVLNQFPVMIDQHIVDGDHTCGMVAAKKRRTFYFLGKKRGIAPRSLAKGEDEMK